MATVSYEKYKTKPFQCWAKAKELRMEHYKDIMTAKEKGKLLVTGGTEGFVALPAGLGDYVYFGAEPYGATISADEAFSLKCMETAEARGYARDLCGYMRNYLGSAFLNRFYFGGEFPKPDFCLQMHICDTHGKWHQLTSGYYQIPMFTIENPSAPNTYQGKKGQEMRKQFLASQIYDSIEWMEKITGRKFDDGKLIEAITNEFRSTSLWAQICILNQNIPAPLDEKTAFSLYVLSVITRHKKEVADFYVELKQEVEERVKDKIVTLSIQRCRLFHDSQPPWPWLDIFRYVEKYGALFVGSQYLFGLGGAMRESEDGTFVAAVPPEDRGIVLKTREDAVNALADWYVEHPLSQIMHFPVVRSDQLVRMMKQWHAQGMVIHLNRGCEGTAIGQMENRLALQKVGIPVMTYEGNLADKRELDPAQIMDRIDAFMESLGLKKIQE